MNKQQITELINSKIIDNDNGQITAEVMRSVLNNINTAIPDGYTYLSTATPATIPIDLTGNEKVFYIAVEKGNYHPDFGLTEPINNLTILRSDSGRWRGELLGFPLDTSNKISEIIQKQAELENNVSSALSKQDSSIETFQKSVRTQVDDYKPIEINGNVNNAADEEDLTSKDGLLQIKNRGTLYGKGYKILRRGVDLQSQFNQENTIYEIRYDFDLGGGTLNIPSGCTLKFEGGSFKNGILDAELDAPRVMGYGGFRCKITDAFSTIRTSWFGIDRNSDAQYNAEMMNAMCNPSKSTSQLRRNNPTIMIEDSFTMSENIVISRSINIIGVNSSSNSRPTLYFPDSAGFVWKKDGGFYSSDNRMSSINIVSKGHCIDFGDRTKDTNAPINVYYSRFDNMNLTSQEGSCVFRKDNGQGLFSTSWSNLWISAPNGYGFVGFHSIDNIFEKITTIEPSNTGTDEVCKSIFCNSAVLLRDSNIGDWNIDNIFYFDSSYNKYSDQLKIENCNIECINKGVVAGEIGNYSLDIAVVDSTVYYFRRDKYNNESLTFDIFSGQIVKIDLSKMSLSITDGLASGYSLVNSYYGDTFTYIDSFSRPYKVKTGDKTYIPNNSGNVNVTLSQGGSQITVDKKKVGIFEKDVYSTRRFNLKRTEDYKSQYTATLYVGAEDYIEVIHSNPLYVAYFEFFSVADPSLPSVYNNNVENTHLFTIYNNSKQRLQFPAKVVENGPIILAPYETAYFLGNISDKKITFLSSDNTSKKKAGSTESRPDTSFITTGFQFFDTTLNKPIWWNGTNWVDSNGNAV